MAFILNALQVNQIGTVTESIQAALDSKAAGWGVMVSHRSGETEDNFIADLSVGLASGQVLFFTLAFTIYHLTSFFMFKDHLSSFLSFLFCRSRQALPAEANV